MLVSMKILLLLLAFLPAVCSADLSSDRASLLRLRAVVHGNTRLWNTSDQTPCSWRGVFCNNVPNRRVIEVHLPFARLSGPIPQETIGNLTLLQILSLRSNLLSGELPTDLGSCIHLRKIFLQNNRFSGKIPNAVFQRLKKLEILDISANRFSGELPDLTLAQINVSYNRLKGKIPGRYSNLNPTAFAGNTLCGAPLHSCPKLSPGSIVGIIIGSVFAFMILVRVVEYFRKKEPTQLHPLVFDEELVFIPPEQEGRFTLEDYTNDGGAYLGWGRTGRTSEKAGKAVKRFDNFSVEPEVFRMLLYNMRALNHPNLLRLKGYFCGQTTKLVMFDFMATGSLHSLLHGPAAGNGLTMQGRSNIAYHVARALEYLHVQNFPHGNLKASNIVLGHQQEAFITEFGLTRLVQPINEPNGYRPPEMENTQSISREGDVYSYGVLFLELLTGLDPTETQIRTGSNLPAWVNGLPDGESCLAESLRQQPHDQLQIQRLRLLGLRCAAEDPHSRPAMSDVVQRIRNIFNFEA